MVCSVARLRQQGLILIISVFSAEIFVQKEKILVCCADLCERNENLVAYQSFWVSWSSYK